MNIVPIESKTWGLIRDVRYRPRPGKKPALNEGVKIGLSVACRMTERM